MKNKFLLVLVCIMLSSKSFAQQEINTDFKTQMDATFGNLDKTKIPNGILLDYGMEFTNVPAYNGTLTDSTYADTQGLKQIYNTLLSSRIRDVSDGFVSPTDYNNRWQTNRSSDYIAVGGLFFTYAQFIDNPVSSNKITVSNNVLYDKYINGVWQNPYQVSQTFAMAPAIKKYEGLNFQVKIPSAIFYSNSQGSVQSIQIDFDNGAGYTTIPLDQLVSVTYTSEGAKNWKYKLTLTNGSSLYSQSRIKIIKGTPILPYVENSSARIAPGNPTPQIVAFYSKTITAVKPYSGSVATINLTIDLAAGHSQITKPLIVAEGFDVGAVFSPENIYGLNTYTQFKQGIFDSNSNDLKNLIWASNKQYDVIYVDWKNGADYLQRNAFALEEAINWVNQQKLNNGSTEQNVVLGQSMGGVIARYALADMEQNNINPNTRLFISHDAPQQGANIPVSLQYLYRHVTNQYIRAGQTLFGGLITIPLLNSNYDADNILSVLDVPAARQLLSNWSNLNYDIDNSVSNSFYNELKSKGITNSGGYPINSRNISISDGAECGTTQDFNPNDLLMSYQYNKSLSVLQDLLGMVVIPLGGTIGSLVIDQNLFGISLLGLIPGKSTFTVDFLARAMPYGSGNQIYKGKVSYTKKILWLWPKITLNLTNVQKNQPAGILPLDTYGGGFYDTSSATGTMTVPNLYARNKFGFIPTTSALDIGKRNVVLTDNDYKSQYVGALPPAAPQNSPFSNFSASFDKFNANAGNRPHISFDTRNGDWLAAELNNASYTSNCSYICSGVQIAGAENICSNAENYSVPTGATNYNWTITQGANLVTLTGNGSSTITLAALPNVSGLVTLTLSMGDNNSKCGNITLTKTITVFTLTTLPTPAGTFRIEGGVSCDNDGAKEVIFLPDSPFYGNITLTPSILPHPLRSQTRDITVKYTNPCTGASVSQIIVYNYVAPDCNFDLKGSTAFFTLSPNPTKDVINIFLLDEAKKPENTSNIYAELYNTSGIKQRQATLKNNKAKISTDGMLQGVYTVKIYYDNKVENHQIIKK